MPQMPTPRYSSHEIANKNIINNANAIAESNHQLRGCFFVKTIEPIVFGDRFVGLARRQQAKGSPAATARGFGFIGRHD